MNKLRFQLLDSKVVEHYSVLPIEYLDGNEEGYTLLKDITDDKLKTKIKETHKKYNYTDVELPGNDEVVNVDGYSGLVVMKDADTNTTIIVEMPLYDHDGNDFYLLDNGTYTNVCKDTKFTEENITQLLDGVTKLYSKAEVSNDVITLEPSNNCWIEYMKECVKCEEVECENSKEYWDKLEEKVAELEVRIDDTSLLEVLLDDYKGKIVHTEVDNCGGIMKIQELKSLDELDCIRIHTCL